MPATAKAAAKPKVARRVATMREEDDGLREGAEEGENLFGCIVNMFPTDAGTAELKKLNDEATAQADAVEESVTAAATSAGHHGGSGHHDEDLEEEEDEEVPVEEDSR